MRYKLNDITLYYHPTGDDAIKFTIRQNAISGRYVESLNGYKPKGTTRISVQLAEEDNIGYYVGSILCADAAFDKDAYWRLDVQQQDLMILNTIHRVVILCADKFLWEKERFKDAYHKVSNELSSKTGE
ncbi:hypothetical protein LLH06_00425 [Mucilaginibacter daejeonensis]|uniref:hypothetical protein n=1 Tax=Mucilaginibacter daejeonensis TaxID=398049 RepID=UPI001D1787CC|nr:hypothetical protein [Mucilaginibacter daejeonensis]UEG53442.1 hypothetical protein LLH06_00425 [Mucilaginibacter daejeonensis]